MLFFVFTTTFDLWLFFVWRLILLFFTRTCSATCFYNLISKTVRESEVFCHIISFTMSYIFLMNCSDNFRCLSGFSITYSMIVINFIYDPIRCNVLFREKRVAYVFFYSCRLEEFDEPQMIVLSSFFSL